METQAVDDNAPLIPAHTRQATKAILLLLFFSFLMFTLPFLVFYGTRRILEEHYHVTGFANTAWSVISAVVTVNLIIVIYAIMAYYDKEYDDEGNPIEDKADEKKEQ